MNDVNVEPRPATLRCAYCHDRLVGDAVTCGECHTLLHEECQLDRCPTLGCDSAGPLF
ncbi:MAG: hypothetical protein JKY65_05000 [Planctomycetes bacterium]|nr:hypothetical protein [Planctomycetota bacterium]